MKPVHTLASPQTPIPGKPKPLTPKVIKALNKYQEAVTVEQQHDRQEKIVVFAVLLPALAAIILGTIMTTIVDINTAWWGWGVVALGFVSGFIAFLRLAQTATIQDENEKACHLALVAAEEATTEWLKEAFNITYMDRFKSKTKLVEEVLQKEKVIQINDTSWRLYTLAKQDNTVYLQKTIDYTAKEIVTIHQPSTEKIFDFVLNKRTRYGLDRRKEKLFTYINYLENAELSVEDQHMFETIKEELTVLETTTNNLKKYNIATYNPADIKEILDILLAKTASLIKNHQKTITSNLTFQKEWLKSNHTSFFN